MLQGVYVTVLCPSVCLIYRPLQQLAAGLLLWALYDVSLDVMNGSDTNSALFEKCAKIGIHYAV